MAKLYFSCQYIGVKGNVLCLMFTAWANYKKMVTYSISELRSSLETVSEGHPVPVEVVAGELLPQVAPGLAPVLGDPLHVEGDQGPGLGLGLLRHPLGHKYQAPFGDGHGS